MKNEIENSEDNETNKKRKAYSGVPSLGIIAVVTWVINELSYKYFDQFASSIHLCDIYTRIVNLYSTW